MLGQYPLSYAVLSEQKSVFNLILEKSVINNQKPQETLSVALELAQRRGGLSKQRDLLEWALAIIERHYGLDHPKVAATLASLGNAYGSLGDAQTSHELLERAFAINHSYDISFTKGSIGSLY